MNQGPPLGHEASQVPSLSRRKPVARSKSEGKPQRLERKERRKSKSGTYTFSIKTTLSPGVAGSADFNRVKFIKEGGGLIVVGSS